MSSAPVHTETCPYCGGNGAGSIVAVCPICKGSGRVPVPYRDNTRDQVDDHQELLERKLEACRLYIEAEERLAHFDCPHDAEMRCRCGDAEQRLYAKTIELRRVAVEALSK